jgi:hypothetical protein
VYGYVVCGLSVVCREGYVECGRSIVCRVRAPREVCVECGLSVVYQKRVPSEGYVECGLSIVYMSSAGSTRTVLPTVAVQTYSLTHADIRTSTTYELHIEKQTLYSLACVDPNQITKRVYVGDRQARPIAPVTLRKHCLPPVMCMCVCICE